MLSTPQLLSFWDHTHLRQPGLWQAAYPVLRTDVQGGPKLLVLPKQSQQ